MRRTTELKLLAFAFILLAPTPSAAGVCDDLFGGSLVSGALANIRNATTYTGLLGITILIIMGVLVALGLMYIIGTAFQISRITDYIKTEYLESIFNLIMVVMLVGGIALADNAIVLITQVGGAVVSSSSFRISGSLFSFSVSNIAGATSTSSLYHNVCEAYFNDAINNQAVNIIYLSVNSFIISLVQNFNVNLMPNGFGIEFKPFAGAAIFNSVIGFYNTIFAGIIGVEMGVIFFLAIVYYLFPLFLFLGVLLRSFPWTRAAGGTFLALFIGFYVFLPALMYPFSAVSYSTTPTLITQLLSFITLGFSNIWNAANKVVPSFSLGGIAEEWTMAIVNSSFQIAGLIIAFIISFDLVEAFGDLLGAPALQGMGMLRKIV